MCNNYNDRHGDKRQKQNWTCSEEQKHLSNSNTPSPTMHLFKIKHLIFLAHELGLRLRTLMIADSSA